MAETPAQRASVLTLSIPNRTTLFTAYMPHLKNGGIFIATPRHYELNDEVLMLITLPDNPTKIPVAGHVAWITPEGAQNARPQGIGVHFREDQNNSDLKGKIEAILAGVLNSPRPTNTL